MTIHLLFTSSGMLHAGVGETHINNFLTSLDIPPICHKTVKKCEREVGVVVESEAKDSCRTFLAQEVELTSGLHATSTPTLPEKIQEEPRRENSQTASLSPATTARYERRLEEGFDVPDPAYESWKASPQHCTNSSPPAIIPSTLQSINVVETSSVAEPTAQEATGDGVVGISVSYDCGWAKRGRAMNSLTAVGANIGVQTAKVLGYDTRNKRCITCDTAARLGRAPPKHDCRRNHSGSSKSMEPSIAVSLAKAVGDEGARIACMVGDDDSSTIKKLNEEVGSVVKHSDIGHAKRSLGSKLYDAKTKRKDCKQLTATTILYFQKMFSYALTNNRNKPEELRSTLKTIVGHAYGDHSACSEQWCGFLKKADGYRHSGLPRGKDMTCQPTRILLEGLFAGLADNAERLAPLGSSQSNESLNNTITSKAPKARHYGGSESQDYRTAAAILQKNRGGTYIAGVCSFAVITLPY